MKRYEGSYFYFGPPGTGKTRTLKEQVEKILAADQRPMLVSMTRTAAAELADRVTCLPRDRIGTLHSMAYRQIGTPKIAEVYTGEFNQAVQTPAFRISGKDGNADDPDWDQNRGGTLGDSYYEQYGLLRNRMTPRASWPYPVRQWADAWEDWKRRAGYIDFTDMIERCFENEVPPPSDVDVIVADECQDLSRLEYGLLKIWGHRAGALIMAGDPYQALYTWRGASPEAFFDPDVPDTRRRVLSQSWRLPGEIHRPAVRLISHLSTYRPIEYKPRKEWGSFASMPCHYKEPALAIDRARDFLGRGWSVMFAVSCGYMLNPIIKKLKACHIPFGNPWRLSRGDWNPLLAGHGAPMSNRIMALLRPDLIHGDKARLWTVGELHLWLSAMDQRGLLTKGAAARLKHLQETSPNQPLAKVDDYYDLFNPEGREMLLELLGLLQMREDGGDTVHIATVLKWWRDRLAPGPQRHARFACELAASHGVKALAAPPKCYVGTIHSFKGAEADAVILFTDLSAQGYQAWLRGQRDDIYRMFYVGMTRAREALVVCRSNLGPAQFDLMRYV